MIRTGAEAGFLNDPVDIAELEVVLGGDVQLGGAAFDEFGRGALAGLQTAFDGCGAFRGNDRIVAVRKHDSCRTIAFCVKICSTKAYFLRVQGVRTVYFLITFQRSMLFIQSTNEKSRDAGVVVPAKRGNVHMEEKKPKARREYKDTVFRMLFSDEKNLLSLYNAVTGRSYEDAKELEIVTLDNAVYMGMKNDLAFLLDLHISLYEHQSTKNPNMPLRDLFYISLEYQKYVSDKSLYSSALLKIPAPVFIVFYNGAEDMEERTELRLSQAYEHFEGEPNLELKVMVLNINAGHNAELMEQCRMLKEYAQYVARVRGYTASMKLEEAVRRAIKECIAEGILADFLRKNRAEVEMVSILEYDKEYEEKKLRKAEYEAGEQEGLNRGLAQGIVETGCAYGVSKKEILERLQERLNISCQTAQEYFAMYSGKKIS